MNLKTLVTLLVIVVVPVCAQAQPAPATKEDAQKVFKIISGDKAKTQTFCGIGKLGDQMEEANKKKRFQESRGAVSGGGRTRETTGS